MNKSPFPGMDPYLEIYWRDVHHGLVTYSRDAIQKSLPDDLMARMDERVFLETDIDVKEIYPDVEVVETPTSPAAQWQPPAEPRRWKWPSR